MKWFNSHLIRILAGAFLVLPYLALVNAQPATTCKPTDKCYWQSQLGEQCGVYGKKDGKEYFMECAGGLACTNEAKDRVGKQI